MSELPEIWKQWNSLTEAERDIIISQAINNPMIISDLQSNVYLEFDKFGGYIFSRHLDTSKQVHNASIPYSK